MKTPPDSALADAQGIIADLRRQLDEALLRETATAEVLGVINASPGDLGPVFDAVLEKALGLCGASYGSLQTFDGKLFRAVAIRGLSEAFADRLRAGYRPALANPLSGILGGSAFVHIPDIATSDDPLTRAGVEQGGMRTLLGVPLRRDDALLGQIVIVRPEVRPFSDKQIALLQNFAAQAVIAMENARLITETREALEQQTATAEVLQVINASPGDLTPVFEAMLDRALALCGAAFGHLLIFDSEQFHRGAVRGEPRLVEDLRQRGPIRPAGGLLSGLVAGKDIEEVADLPESDEYRRVPEFRAVVDAGCYRSLLNVALRKEGTLPGVLAVFRKEAGTFSDKQVSLLQNFAAQAVIAMENARLITETREALAQQTATAEVLGVINASPGDLQPVFEAILEKAHSLCGADRGNLHLYDGEFVRAVAVRGQAELANILRQPYKPGPNSAAAPLITGEAFVQVADIGLVDDPIAQAAARMSGMRTVLLVPLRKDGAYLGHIVSARTEVRLFTDKQIALLQNFAAQAVIAMENARLLGELRQRTEEVAELNRGLEARVAEQVEELGRVGRLKRFLAPQLAELIVSQGDEKILESHRREIVVVFCDLRGYTAFTETAEPEEVLDFLREYHGALGPLVSQFEGTLDQFSGDGIMVFFNDPVPIPDPAERAVRMAVAMREAAGNLIAAWRRRRGRVLGFGAGIAQGYATLGQIGFAERSGYTAIGTVCNLAARLCAEAKDGQILLAQPVAVAVEETIPVEEVGELALRGLSQPVVAYNVPLAAGHPALRVIEGGSPSI
jgi:class 3 adenylate cyclase